MLILGAGSSVEYGFPLGPELIRQVVSGLREGDLRHHLKVADFSPKPLSEFAKKLEESDSPSIDAFLEGNVDPFVRIGRAAIGIVILRAERKSIDDGLLTSSPPRDHWLRYVWHQLRSGCTANRFEANRLIVVTFNYDRSFEHYMVSKLAPTFNLSPEGAAALFKRAIPVIHVHGSLTGREYGDYPRTPDAKATGDLALGIRVVHDPVAEHDPLFGEVHDRLRAVKRLCFLGFGFHPVNIGRLAVRLHLGDCEVYACAHGMGRAEVSVALSRLGVKSVTIETAYKAEEFLRHAVPLS